MEKDENRFEGFPSAAWEKGQAYRVADGCEALCMPKKRYPRTMVVESFDE
jgi:hypothetical protein